MILCKFTKLDTARYTPHLNIMRGFVMAMRRKGIKIAYSEGFNPHPKIYLSAPPPVGLATTAEYFAADTSEDPGLFMEKLNESLQPGVRILKSAQSGINPNFAAAVTGARYEIELDRAVNLPSFQKILSSQQYEIRFQQKGETLQKDVRGLIFELCGSKKNYSFTLAYGNKNLRADRLLLHLLQESGASGTGFRIVKTHAYAQDKKDIDELWFPKNR